MLHNVRFDKFYGVFKIPLGFPISLNIDAYSWEKILSTQFEEFKIGAHMAKISIAFATPSCILLLIMLDFIGLSLAFKWTKVWAE